LAPGPAVHILAERDDEGAIRGSGRDFVRIEASRIVTLIAQIRGSRDWQVESSSIGQSDVPSYGDIAVLLPVLTRANVLEDALTEAGSLSSWREASTTTRAARFPPPSLSF